jgi:hypothetical protein
MLAIVTLGMLLLVPTGARASADGGSDAQRSPAAQATDGESRIDFGDGRRHVVFSCPDGYPSSSASLEELYADCELLYVYFCLDLPAWQPPFPHPGCDDPRRIQP